MRLLFPPPNMQFQDGLQQYVADGQGLQPLDAPLPTKYLLDYMESFPGQVFRHLVKEGRPVSERDIQFPTFDPFLAGPGDRYAIGPPDVPGGPVVAPDPSREGKKKRKKKTPAEVVAAARRAAVEASAKASDWVFPLAAEDVPGYRFKWVAPKSFNPAAVGEAPFRQSAAVRPPGGAMTVARAERELERARKEEAEWRRLHLHDDESSDDEEEEGRGSPLDGGRDAPFAVPPVDTPMPGGSIQDGTPPGDAPTPGGGIQDVVGSPSQLAAVQVNEGGGTADGPGSAPQPPPAGGPGIWSPGQLRAVLLQYKQTKKWPASATATYAGAWPYFLFVCFLLFVMVLLIALATRKNRRGAR